jgi:hypothetical protein
MNKIQKLITASLLIVAVISINACKKTFDAPPGPGDVNIVANTSIQALKTYHTIPGVFDMITEDVIISGIVTANDQSGNFYKQLFIQDTTGAIQLLVDGYSLYASYPVGRRVYIKCKGLTLTDSYSNLVLGYKAVVDNLPSIQGIPGAVVGSYLIGGSLNNPVEPLHVTLSQLGTSLSDKYINAFIQLDNYEFSTSDTSKTYGDTSSYKSTVNRNVNLGCGSAINTIVRTSGYANFAGEHLPKGNGSIAAIYTVYRSSPTSSTTTKQLILRDITDVHFDSARCGGNPNPNPNPNPGGRLTIAAVRALYAGANIKLTSSASIAGVVTSDATNKNISTGAFILQDGSGAAITVYAGGTINYNVGDSIVLDITNDSLLNYRGSLELKTPVGFTVPAPAATGIVVTPVIKTIAELNTGLGLSLSAVGNLECVLVKISNATASGNATFSGSNTLTDASGTITLYTSATALFSGTALPSGPKNWTGQGKNYNGTTKEFLIRNTSDVQ